MLEKGIEDLKEVAANGKRAEKREEEKREKRKEWERRTEKRAKKITSLNNKIVKGLGKVGRGNGQTTGNGEGGKSQGNGKVS